MVRYFRRGTQQILIIGWRDFARDAINHPILWNVWRGQQKAYRAMARGPLPFEAGPDDLDYSAE